METESADEEDAVQLENEVFADTSEAFDMNEEYADLPLKSDKDAKGDSKIAKSCFLLTPMPRLMKTSTDSGNVDDDQIEDDSKIVHQNLQTFNYSKSRVAGASSNDNSSSSTSSYDTVENDFQLYQRNGLESKDSKTMANITLLCENVDDSNKENEEDHDKNKLIDGKSAGVSPASSVGGVYTGELLELFALNLHRIEKDVQRCDRNYWYFANENLDKLRNVITTYVWEHLEVGYMQGMCDLVAPLLVIFDDESLTYSCFTKLMERMIENFPNGNAMDMHFANMRSLIQILDPEMYELMDSNGDYTHIYFCYRWFLLDFKRELLYEDVFAVWETIWSSKYVASSHFVLFLALALLETYRDIILSNSMDFTDIIKFFNEMAERHNVPAVLQLARNLVLQLQMILENK